VAGFLPPVVAVLLGNITDYTAKMDEAAAKAAGVDTKLSAAAKASNALFMGVGLAVLGVGVASVKMASDFQTQMTRLYTAAGAPKQAVLDATNQVLSLGNAVGFSGTQMAEALYHPVSAGLDLATSLEVVKFAAQEAQISGASLDDTTYSLSSVMKAFNLPASQAHDTMAELNSIVGQGDMRFQDFNTSIKNWAPTAAQMGISITSMGAALAYLTDRGNSAEEASTRVTMGLTMMATPSKQAAKLLEGLGVASGDVSAATDSMTSILKKTGITQNQLAVDLQSPDGIYVALNHLKDALAAAGVTGTEADSVLSKIFGGGR
jgi:TP901 family phage tail tape measure protein